MSHDSQIMKGLPYSLACEFSCRLTHRSGISDDTFCLERGLIATGLGTKQISDIFCIMDVRKYDQKMLQYLKMIDYMRIALP